MHGYNRPGFLPPQPSCGTDASYPINVIPERRWRSSELSGTHCGLGAAFRQNLAPLLGCLNLRELSILHALETDCVAGHVGFELRCAERKFISLTSRVSSDSGAPAETAAVPRENDLLC